MAEKDISENKKQKTCQAERWDRSLCKRSLYDKKHCIFHSEDKRKKKTFNNAFWKELKRQKKEDEVYDFSRFVFLDSISFVEIIFEKNVSFHGAKFSGEEICFDRVRFKRDVFFIETKFILGEKVSFKEAKFLGDYTSFIGSEFSYKKTYFSNTYFSNVITYFNEAKFSGIHVSFAGASFSGENTFFSGVKFSGKNIYFSGANFSSESIEFHRTKFSGEKTIFIETKFNGNEVDFTGVEFSGKEIDLFNAYFYNIDGFFEGLTRKTKMLKRVKYKVKNFLFKLGEESAIKYPLIKRMTQDAWFLDDFKRHHPLIYKLWKLTSNCGRNILLWAAWALGIALLFGLIFILIGPDAFDLRHDNTGFSFFYYSIVTFTTLGFGDITPKTLGTEILITIEVILGYIMLGGLISIFANKLARRS